MSKLRRGVCGALLLWFGTLSCPLGAKSLPAAPGGQVESGVPPVRVFSRAALGLDGLPSDLQRLPDGRLLVVSPRQLVFGDGARWELFDRAGSDRGVPLAGVAVAADGRIYAGMANGFGEVVFDSSGHWRLQRVAVWPDDLPNDIPVPRYASVADGQWLWHSDSGIVLQWNPGQPAVKFGHASTVESIFAFGGMTYISDRVVGQLLAIDPQTHRSTPVFEDPVRSTDEAISAAVPFDADHMLVGTFADGLRLFDGHQLAPLAPLAHDGMLSHHSRITALAPAPDDHFVAVVEGVGLAYFNRAGEVREVIDRNRDSRLTRIRRLVPTEAGVYWVLLPEGIARVELPSALTTFQSLLPSGLDSVTLSRSRGKLWLLADGDLLQGTYDAGHRLVAFADETPPDAFIFSLGQAWNTLVAGSTHGIYLRTGEAWQLVDRSTSNFRLVDGPDEAGRRRYIADGEFGWVRWDGAKFQFERTAVPGLESAFDTQVDGAGSSWLEMGAGRLGRLREVDGRLELQRFAGADGVPDGWVQVFVLDGLVRFNIADQLYRFDDDTQRIVPDLELRRHLADYRVVIGRPERDPTGLLWVTCDDRVRVFDTSAPNWREVDLGLPVGLAPYYITIEENGVVWLHGGQMLARVDPGQRLHRHPPTRTLLTRVSLPGLDRSSQEIGPSLPDVPYRQNSITFHFAAPGADLLPPTTFEVKLQDDAPWEPQGGSGAVTFNHLSEGDYHFQVRARNARAVAALTGIRFKILPPWYRSNVAFITYGASALGFIGLLVWFSTLLERRENNRLDRLVKRRTDELKLINQKLERQVDENRVLSQAITQSPVSILIAQTDDTIVYANPRACELTGFRETELIGRTAQSLRWAEGNAELLAEIRRVLAAGQSWTGETINRHADGRAVHLRSTISPIRQADNSAKYYLILEEDISAQVAEKERHLRLEDQLFQARKLESIGTLAGGIAHDFNNILTGILGNCEIALMDLPPESSVASDLRDIRQSGLRAKDLVSQILTFSRKAESKLTPIDLAVPVAEAVRLIRASTPALIEIDSQLTSGTASADATQIHQVVLNLCTNAVQAIADRPGRITVELSPQNIGTDLTAEISNLRRGRYLVLRVTDTGSGMSSAVLERIFDPFFTTKDQGKGTGLGLSIVQGVVASHRGAYRVTSTENVGTTFELFFPVCDAVPAIAEVPREPILRGEAREVLVVDDERSVVEFVATRLRQFGYAPVVHLDPRQALADLRGHPTRFSALVTDLTMPHLSGADLIQSLRDLGSTIPAIVITGYGRENALEKLHQLSNVHVLGKPFTGEELVRLLGRAITPART